jgi:hypothetical protein
LRVEEIKIHIPEIAIPSGTLWINMPIATVIPNSWDSLALAAYTKVYDTLIETNIGIIQ